LNGETAPVRLLLKRAANRYAALSTVIGYLAVMQNRLGRPRRVMGPAIDLPSNGLRILVVDPNLPRYDQMSGSLRLFRLLGLLREAGHHVTFLARKAGQQEPYRSQLEGMGIVVHAGDPERLRQRGAAGFGRRLDLPGLLRHGRFDVAWLDFFELAEQYLPEIRAHAPSTRILIDTIDVHWVRQRRQADIEDDADGRRRAEIIRLREEAVYRAADGLIAVTEDDAQALRQLAPDVPAYVLGNVHSLEESGPGPESRSGVVFVGNFNHPPNVDAALYLLREVMPLVWATCPAMSVTIVGTNPPPAVRELAGSRVTVTGHVPSTRPYLDAARVSVAPLRFGAGMKGKVGEALAVGLPVVTTAIGAEGMGLEDGIHALIIDSAAGLAGSIRRLNDDDALWSRLSESGRREVGRRYGPDAARVLLADLLDKVTSGSAPIPTAQVGAHA
jgi:glycosyltransferase involved in cell wall biosynthesis